MAATAVVTEVAFVNAVGIASTRAAAAVIAIEVEAEVGDEGAQHEKVREAGAPTVPQ